jgi:hypothetical protein
VTDTNVGAAIYFFLPFVIAAIGALVHTRRVHAEGARALELWLVWWTVTGGVVGVLGGFAHIGPNSDEVAEGIGYAQSFFQWEVGWMDLGLAALMVGTAWRRDFGWLLAAVVMWTIGYGGDAIGHAMQWIAHDNTAPSNTWALPADIIGPAVAIGLLAAYHRARSHEQAQAGALATT